jgi:hypothetical protein
MANQTHNHVYPDPDGYHATTPPAPKPGNGKKDVAQTSTAEGAKDSVGKRA